MKKFIAEVEGRVAVQTENRKLIANATPLAEGALRQMDSALKRTTAFMKKLKNVSAAQHDAIIADLKKVSVFFPFRYSGLSFNLRFP